MRQLIGPEELADRIRLYGAKLDRLARTSDVTFLPVMHGAGWVFQHLMEHISPESTHRERWIVAQSYGDGREARPVRIYADWLQPEKNVAGRHVVVIDDVLDTGLTIDAVVKFIEQFAPASVRTFFMLRKDCPRRRPCEPDYVMFDVPDVWLVGAGLDHEGKFRHLPYVAELPRDGQSA